jgi:SPW repeat
MDEQRRIQASESNGGASSWVNIILGIWILVSPFVLALSLSKVRWNNVATGIVVGILANYPFDRA